MDIKYKLYPYPVLAEFNDNYVNASFSVEASLERDGFDVQIHVKAQLTDEMLRDFISDGTAIIVYHLECAQTGFRRIVQTDKYEEIIPIKSASLAGELHFCPFVLAKEDIINYHNPNFHSDYSKPIPKISAGCPLAIGRQKNWPITKNMVDLLKTSSPFRIMKNVDISYSHMVIEYESEPRIKIKLSANDYSMYKNMAKDARLHDILVSAVVVPALLYVLGQLQKCGADEMNSNYGDLQWFMAIRETLKNNFHVDICNIKDENVFELSQRLLKTPINSAFENLASLGSDIGQGEEEE